MARLSAYLLGIQGAFPLLMIIIGSLGGTASLNAQAPDYRPPPPPRNNGAFELRARWLFAPTVEFKGLGNVPLAEDYTSENNLVLGTERQIRYDDGGLAQDYVAQDFVAGESGSGVQLSPDTAATANFSYQNEAQAVNNDTAVAFHRYAAEGNADQVFSAEGSDSLGWEVNYTQYLNARRRLGFQVGFSFNGFDSAFKNEVESDLRVLEFVHEIADGDSVPDLPEDENGEPTGEPFTGVRVLSGDDGETKIEWVPSETGETVEIDNATVRSEMELRSSVYTFRAGPTYSLGLGKRFNFNLGAGVSALYYSGSFAAYEFLMLEEDTMGPARPRSLTESSEWQVGGYVDASAYYNLTQRVSLFSGLQFQSGSSYEQLNREREVEVDYSSQVYVHAGLGIKF